eukprot:538838-Rhodomonas_salina.1
MVYGLWSMVYGLGSRVWDSYKSEVYDGEADEEGHHVLRRRAQDLVTSQYKSRHATAQKGGHVTEQKGGHVTVQRGGQVWSRHSTNIGHVTVQEGGSTLTRRPMKGMCPKYLKILNLVAPQYKAGHVTVQSSSRHSTEKMVRHSTTTMTGHITSAKSSSQHHISPQHRVEEYQVRKALALNWVAFRILRHNIG